MTICALLLARQFYDLAAEHAPEVRHARAAVRQRVDRRHADALRRAAGVDGRAAPGAGTCPSCSATSAGGRCWRSSRRRSSYFLLFRRELRSSASRPAAPGRRRARRRPRRRSGMAAGARLDHRRPHVLHGLDGAHGALSGVVPRRLPGLPGIRQSHGARTRARSSSRRRCWSGSSWPGS